MLKVIHWFIRSTVPEFICNWTETTSSAGSRYGVLVRTRVRSLYSHLPKWFAPKGEINLSSIQSNQTRQVWIFFALIPHLLWNSLWKRCDAKCYENSSKRMFSFLISAHRIPKQHYALTVLHVQVTLFNHSEIHWGERPAPCIIQFFLKIEICYEHNDNPTSVYNHSHDPPQHCNTL